MFRRSQKIGAKAPRRSLRAILNFESLEAREVPAVTAFFNAGTLTVLGDDLINQITVGAAPTGDLTVVDGNTVVQITTFPGQQPIKANLQNVTVFGRGGDDIIILDSSLNTGTSGPTGFFAPTGTLFGEAGNDTLISNMGGFLGTVDANGVIVGTILGNVTMDGGEGNDFLDSGFGNDIMFGGNGDDTYRWRPGTLTDIWDGGAGNDSVLIIGNGNGAGDAFSLSAGQNGRVLFQRTNLVQFSVDIAGTETITLQPDSNANGGADTVTINDLTGVTSLTRVVVNAGAGNDTISAATQANRAISMIFNGEDGNDTIRGGFGKDSLFGGAGNDTITGGGVAPALDGSNNTFMDGGDGNDFLDSGFGNDTMLGGNGDDMYRWLPGTINDIWDGGAGNDSALIVGNGGGAGDAFQLTAGLNGRVLFQRTNIVAFFVDIGTTETVIMQPDLNGTGADTVAIGDLTGVQFLTRVITNAGDGNDTITAAKQANRAISMLLNGEAGNDTITGGFGRDTLTGGAGDDIITGGGVAPALDGSNNTFMDGGDGNDQLISGFGNDTILGGNGNDTYKWLPGTINDIFDGGAGFDTSIIIGNDTFQGAPAGDQFVLQAGPNGRLRFDRTNLVPFFVDMGTTENVQLLPGAGNDIVTIQNLTGVRNLQYVFVDGGVGNDLLSASNQASTTLQYVYLSGNAGDDTLIGAITGVTYLYDFQGGNNTILGGSANEFIYVDGTGSNFIDAGAGNDYIYDYSTGRSFISAGAGNDFVTRGASKGSSTILGGDGNDTLIGGQGADNIDGGAGDDVLYGSDPNLQQNESDPNNPSKGDGVVDTLTGGAGSDIFYIFGADVRDIITDFNDLEDKIIII